MASPFQQQSLTRKLIYLGVIIGLFSGSWALRRYSLEPQANAMAALEENQGEMQLHAAALRLGLTGSRGMVTCFLWSNAIEKQKRHEWNELEVNVRSLTTLQPHFMTPWLFQSWNLAYNVSVECDRVNDKYFYISRGVELQAEGERQNRNNPDMRYWVGFYIQHKICQSDETNVQRSLLQLSNIPPNERDPARFWSVDSQGRRTINMKEFEQFCKDNPQLVRRLQQGIPRDTKGEDRRQFKCATPEAVVQFLADNRRIPSVYYDAPPEPIGAWTKKADKMRPVYDRFPLLPPPPGDPGTLLRPRLTDDEIKSNRWQSVPFDPAALTWEAGALKDYQDGYTIARAWYGFSLEPVPPPDPMVSGITQDVVDRNRQHRPKHMAAILFRHYPARAQSYVGERLQQEGWYDEDGWEVTNWFGDKKVVIGTSTGEKSRTAWEQARQMWETHGLSNHLLFPSAEAEDTMTRKAQKFAQEINLPLGVNAPPMRVDTMSPTQLDEFNAYRVMTAYKSNLTMTNFAHHYHRAAVESEPDTVAARKRFHRAEALRLSADLGDALAEYEKPDALAAWKNKVLLGEGHKDFRRDEFIQEQTFEFQLKYLDLVNEQLKLRLTRLQPLVPLMPRTSADVFTDWILTTGPFDVNDADGVPLVSEETKKLVHSRRKGPSKATPPPGQPQTGVPGKGV